MKKRVIDTPELVSRSLEVIHSSPADCLSNTLELICRRLNSDYGVILTVNRNTSKLALDVLYGYPPHDAKEHRSERLKLPIVNSRKTLLTTKKRSVSAEALLEADLSGEAKPVVKLGKDRTSYSITSVNVQQVMGYAVETMGEYVAVLTLETLEEKAFDKFINPGEQEKKLLKTCSNLISVALAVRQSLVFKFDELIKVRNFNNFETLGEEVINWVLDKFKVNSCAIYSIEYDRATDKDYVVCKKKIIDGSAEIDLKNARYLLGEGYCGWVAANNASLILTEFENENSKELSDYQKRYNGDRPTRTGKFKKKYGDSIRFKSYLGVPLHDGKNLVGVLEVLDTARDYAFSDEGLLEMIGYRVALEYSRISMDKKRESLFHIPNIETSDIQKVIRGVVDAAMKLTSATHGFFMDKEEGYFYPRAVRGYKLKQGDIKETHLNEVEEKKNLVHLVMSIHDNFVCQNIKDSNLKAKEKKYLANSVMPTGFIPDFIQSLLMVPVYLIRPINTGNEVQADGNEKEFEDLGVLVLMSSKANAFQQDEVLITALADIVAYHIWGNERIAELASEREQVSELKQALHSYDIAMTAATASAGTVHTAKKHIFDVSETIKKITAHKKIREDKDLLALARQTEKQFEELQNLYDRLHDVFGGIKPNFELCDLAELVQDARAYMEPTFRERKIEFRSSLNLNRIPRIKADSILVKVVFINLIRNSIDANARIISIHGNAALIGDDPQERIEAVEIIIEDDGIGVPQEDWEKVFKPFISANKKGGTGLGLAVNFDILDKHGGGIEIIRSEVGRGTAISVKWPLDPARANT